MSHTEFHKGVLRVLTRSSKETLDYIENNDLEDIIKESGWCDEVDFEVNPKYNDKYFILHKDGIYSGMEMDCWLCEFIEHSKHEGGGDYLADVRRIDYDVYEFTCIFYNGGTWLGEILDDKISKLEKEDYSKESDTITISPRESYMILDCCNFVLNEMKKQGLDYLFCNYSTEEIAKLGQRFGDMNLKNMW